MDIPLTKLQKQIIIGTLLGDGCLEFSGFHGSRLQVKQAKKYKNYVFWMHEKLENLCKSTPKQRRDNKQWYFSTRHLNKLTELRKLFYSQNKKQVPANISKLLISPLSIAIWYMDDGCLDWRPKDHYAFTLSTDCFSLKDVSLLQETLQKNFGVVTSVHNSLCRGKRYPKIYIGAKGRDKFLSLIKPYILDCFSHKLPPL